MIGSSCTQVPHLAWLFFEPHCPVDPMLASADPVRIVGYSSEYKGLRRPTELTDFLQEHLMRGVTFMGALSSVLVRLQ